MIHKILDFLKAELTQYLTARAIVASPTPPPVNYVGINQDPPTFPEKSISLLLVNLEEEKTLRPPDRHSVRINGQDRKVSPPLKLNLFLLFAVKHNKYEEAIKLLSGVISFFQANPLFDSKLFPALPEEFDKLVVELYSLAPSQQNEIWSMLKTAYLPSVLYQVRMILVLQEEFTVINEIEEIQQNLGNR